MTHSSELVAKASLVELSPAFGLEEFGHKALLGGGVHRGFS